MSLANSPNSTRVNYNLNNGGSFSLFLISEVLTGSDCPQSRLQSKHWCMEFTVGFPWFISAYVLLNFHSSILPSHVLIKFACKSSYRTYYACEIEKYVKRKETDQAARFPTELRDLILFKEFIQYCTYPNIWFRLFRLSFLKYFTSPQRLHVYGFLS